MLNALIGFSLKNRFAVILVTAILVVFGVRSALRLPLDAFPDTTPVQVQVNSIAPELSAEEVERQITFPVEFALSGLKGLDEVRSLSKFGLSQVIATFSDATDIYFARQQITERLNEVELPTGIARPTLGPVATGVGEIHHYILTSDIYDLTELRTIQDWLIRPRLRQVAGIAEVNPWGGLAKQFEVRTDPDRLSKYGLTLDDLTAALRQNNRNVGGGYIVQAGRAGVIQGVGRLRDLEEIAQVVLTATDGDPIRVRDVAEVVVGHVIRRGAVTADGEGEVVLGLAFMRMGENSRTVSAELDEAIADVRATLPPGVNLDVVYARTELVDSVLHTIERNLLEGALLVVAVLFAFLGNLRAGLIVASAIPLSMLFAATMMERVGIAGSLMSLGALDFGLIVDSSVVMVENCVRHISQDRSGRSKLEIIRDAAVEVRRPTMFGELIIMVVYLPILALEGVEGKLFRPMALTVVFALLGSLVLSLTLMPALASLGISRKVKEKETIIDRTAHRLFQPVLGLGLRFPRFTLLCVGIVTVAGTILGFGLGSDFVPRLGEGSIVIQTTRHPSVSLEDSIEYGRRLEAILLEEFPDEIDRIWSRTGTPEIATDPMGFQDTDVFISLKPRSEWTRATSQEGLVTEMAKITETIPGTRASFSQPIEMRVNEMIAGVRSDLAVKIFGEDLGVLRKKGAEVVGVLRAVQGAADVAAEQIAGQSVVRVIVDRDALARHGVPARAVLDAVRAAGAIDVGEILEPGRRFPLAVRLPAEDRTDPKALGRLLINTESGERLPLEMLATVEEVTGPAAIYREWGRRRIIVQANVRGRDLGSFVEEAQRKVEAEVVLPAGYSIAWGGQFENLSRAEARLAIVIPLALALVLSLLYLTFGSVRDALMVFSGVLFARVGGVLGLYVMDLPFTVSAGVGFVALAGASMLEGLILVSAIRDRMAAGMAKRPAIEAARLARLRPVLMTGTVAALGFVPMMLSTGIGAEVQRPLATVVVFGMACDTILTMLALPCLYLLFGKGPTVTPSSSRPSEAELEADSEDSESTRVLEAVES